ncbi:transposase [Leptothoe sp. LEGE 181152]|uniref:transposase n=1 Tax=Adonisia turfae TaxID=2950184 RepID=UPI0013D3A5B0|nr:transposase [Leptothoe sp. LEGE 181152]
MLLFQPPYSPEVNPIERVWLELKRYVQWQHFTSLEDLQNKGSQWVAQLTPEQIKSLTQWDWIVDALCVAGL